MPDLNDKQRAFIAEYLIDLNATQAAIRAGYSKNTAMAQSCRLLANVKIQEAVQAAKADRANETGITGKQVILELARIAFSDMTDSLEPNSNGEGFSLKNLLDIPPELRRCIKTIEQKPIVTKESGYIGNAVCKVSFYDKVKALELLGKHLGIWKEDQKTPEVGGGLKDLIKAIEQSGK